MLAQYPPPEEAVQKSWSAAQRGTQLPAAQVSESRQAWPQLPQLAESVRSFTHAAPQSERGEVQAEQAPA
jgi:hypothetical protein